ncbi:retrovirus-related pol polyprotein from transposon TNT 1-94 [Tanacetum coccineum]
MRSDHNSSDLATQRQRDDLLKLSLRALVLLDNRVRYDITLNPVPQTNVVPSAEKSDYHYKGWNFSSVFYLKNIIIKHMVKLRTTTMIKHRMHHFQEDEFINPFCTGWFCKVKWLGRTKWMMIRPVIRNKARLVAKGYRSGEGIDFEVHLLSCSLEGSSILLPTLLTVFSIYSMDVKTAFLNGPLKEEVYVAQPEGSMSMIYVDDIIFGSTNPKYSKGFEKLMHSRFEMSLMGEMKFFLGLQIHQSPKGGEPVDQSDYRSKIGSLMYLTSSRPDLVQAVCYCARYQARPTQKHLKEVKRIFKYLKGTINMGLWYPKDSGFELTAFSDADHAGCLDTRKSTSGGIQFLGDKLVSWMSKKQNCTAMSSAEAEYVALSASCAQVMWMRTQLQDYGFNYNKIPLYCDSQSAIAISCNPVQHSRTKHIHTRFEIRREMCCQKVLKLRAVRRLVTDSLNASFNSSSPRVLKGITKVNSTWKGDEGTLKIPTNSKHQVFNSRTYKVEENLHVKFSEDTPNIMQKKDAPKCKARMKTVPDKDYILLPFLTQDPLLSTSLEDSPDAGFKPLGEEKKKDAEDPENKDSESHTGNAAVAIENHVHFEIFKNIILGCDDDPNMPNLEEIVYSDDDESVRMQKADIIILDKQIPVSSYSNYQDFIISPTWNQSLEIMRIKLLKQENEQRDFGRIWIKASYAKKSSSIKLQEDWTLVRVTNKKKSIGTKWVFRNKKDERGIVIKNKARLVAQGYTQEEGIDYDEVFARVARIEAIRLFLAYASFKDLWCIRWIVKSAFIYGKIEEEVYVCQPLRFEDPDFPDRVNKVEKALYGLHQAP